MTADAPPPPQNRLEELLEQAALGDADAQERFATVLLDSDLYVVGNAGDAGQLRIPTAQLGEETVIPVFTSPVRLEAATGGGRPYVGLRGRDLFARRERGLKVALNPGVWHGTLLLSDDIDRMLGGGVATVPAGASVMLGLAARRPDALVAQLRDWLATRPDVVAARLAQIFDERSGQPPHPLVGLGLGEGGSIESVFASAPAFDGPVDLVPLAGHPLGEWLEENGEQIYP